MHIVLIEPQKHFDYGSRDLIAIWGVGRGSSPWRGSLLLVLWSYNPTVSDIYAVWTLYLALIWIICDLTVNQLLCRGETNYFTISKEKKVPFCSGWSFNRTYR